MLLFLLSEAAQAQSITALPTTIVTQSLLNPVTMVVKGTNTSWTTTGTVFSSSNPVTLNIISQVISSPTTAVLTVVPGPPDGTVTISDGTNTTTVTVTTPDSAFEATLLSYMPDLYSQSWVMKTILLAQSNQLNALYQAVGDTLNASFVSTAPSWGLTLWEDELAITNDPTLSLTDNQRRATILQKLAGQGTPTIKAVIQSIAQYKDGTVAVYEDFSNYTIYIQFVSEAGTPANLSALEDTVRAFVPAHLNIQYVLNLLTWDKLDSLNLSWDALDAIGDTWTQLTNEVNLNPPSSYVVHPQTAVRTSISPAPTVTP